jgi:hypothetical protein
VGHASSAINYSGINNVQIAGGKNANSFSVFGTAAGASYTLAGGKGGATVDVGTPGSVFTLADIQGALTYKGQGGTNTVEVYDQLNKSAGQTYTFGANSLTGSGAATITYGGVSAVTINGASGGDAFVETATPGGTVTLNGGGGNNSLTGPNGTDTWTVNKANGGNLNTNVSFNAVAGLIGGTGNNTFDFTTTTAAVGTIEGGTGNNTLKISHSGTWDVTGANAGTFQSTGTGTLNYSGIANLVGGTVFALTPAGTETSINGSDGAEASSSAWLDNTAFSAPVSVNLATGAATNVNGGAAGGVKNIQNVFGGSGGSTLIGDTQGNILVGGSGNDTITGGKGQSLLIANGSAGTVTGGSTNGDILIGATTSYDADTAPDMSALMAILSEWQSPAAYTSRVQEINQGFSANDYSLNFGTTVQGDSATIQLVGDPSTKLDWFFKGPDDKLENQVTGETVSQ